MNSLFPFFDLYTVSVKVEIFLFDPLGISG